MRILLSMKVPMWLIRLILSYLENRKMILRFRGCSSNPKDMPGGMPQGTLLGVILYILYINPVGFPSEITTDISDILHKYWEVLDDIPAPVSNYETLPETLQSIKFMDDATVQEVIDLPPNLEYIHADDELVLQKENTKLQNQIEKIKKLSDEREMSLNSGKTFLLIINFTNNYQFRPLLQVPGSLNAIETKEETKLLGYWLTSNMKPQKHVEHMLGISYNRLWAIPKLKKAGVPEPIFSISSILRSDLFWKAIAQFSIQC